MAEPPDDTQADQARARELLDILGIEAPTGEVARTDRGRDFDAAVREMLAFAHRRTALDPIRCPDEQGAFPSHWLGGGAGLQVPSVVVDANILRNDIARACSDGRRLTMVNAANAGAIRLFCGTHVIREIERWAETWAHEFGLSPESYRATWRTEYVPLLRQVRPQDLTPSMFTSAERDRLSTLALVDPDDLGSAALAIALGAFHLSEDKAALTAVYGDALDLERHHAWLRLLMASGDAGELGKVMFGGVAISRVAVYGVHSMVKWLAERLPPIAMFGIVGALVLIGVRVGRARWDTVRPALAQAGDAILHLCAAYVAAYAQLEAASAPVPSTERLVDELGNRPALARICMRVLARHPESQLTARRLSVALAGEPLPHSERLVRETLRATSCFRNTYHGYWQAGHPVWT